MFEGLVATSCKGDVWRLVEAQHRVSTLKLTDTLEEQALLERMLEDAKPALPPECVGLDYLLAAPFRYTPYPDGSRFRRAGRTKGVFYASEKQTTAVAELAFYRLLFFAESPQTPFPDAPTGFTAFSVTVKTTAALDLTKPENADPALESLTEYAPCQALADKARQTGIEAIRYRSVRDLERGCNVALLTAKAFAAKGLKATATWRIKAGTQGVLALRDFPVLRIMFDRQAFAADPRLAGFNWQR